MYKCDFIFCCVFAAAKCFVTPTTRGWRMGGGKGEVGALSALYYYASHLLFSHTQPSSWSFPPSSSASTLTKTVTGSPTQTPPSCPGPTASPSSPPSSASSLACAWQLTFSACASSHSTIGGARAEGAGWLATQPHPPATTTPPSLGTESEMDWSDDGVVNQAGQCKPRPRPTSRSQCKPRLAGQSMAVVRLTKPASTNQDYQAKVSQHCRAHLVTFTTPSRLQKEGCWKVAWEAWSRLTLRQIWSGADRFAFFCGGMGGRGVDGWQCQSSFLSLSLSFFLLLSFIPQSAADTERELFQKLSKTMSRLIHGVRECGPTMFKLLPGVIAQHPGWHESVSRVKNNWDKNSSTGGNWWH